PEVVKNEPYGEKADVWALGCILYQMAALQPPFYSSNMLSLANKIVEAQYEPVEEGAYSERVTDMIRWCLSPDAEQRPDIQAVSSRISDLMMRLMDGLYTSQNALERRAERDRKRAQKYFLEKQRSRTSCCQSYMCQVKRDVISQSGVLEDLYLWRMCSVCNGGRGFTEHALQEMNVSNQIPLSGLTLSFSRSAFLLSGDYVMTNDKPRPVSAGICVSQKKLRQIDDPIQRLLVQLHKIIFITQLPPSPQHDIKRRVVERFKKSLFQCGSDPYNLKAELSQVPVHLIFFFLLTGDVNLKDGVTYQQMQVRFSAKVVSCGFLFCGFFVESYMRRSTLLLCLTLT
uniref:Protein kinase domain-containing protein n=1 Tax=Labrus bergylta TaxID=56723 RepID=A0A3Q3EPB0_9LABR